MRLSPRDRDMFASYLNNTLEPNQDITLARQNMDQNDFRVTKPKMIDIAAESREFNEFKSQKSYSNTLYCEGLLSRDFSVSQEQLTENLSKIGMTKNEINDVMHNLANHKDVIYFKNPYTSEVSFRKKS